jgi:putative redox protein
MVEVDAVYEGKLRCRVTHGPSGQAIQTDAPKDNAGEGAAFSPTDLVAAALGSCLLTTMGIVARRHGLELTGTRVHVVKEMTAQPSRRISQLSATVTFAQPIAPSSRSLLERAALSCPVHHSLHPDIEAPVRFVYPAASA